MSKNLKNSSQISKEGNYFKFVSLPGNTPANPSAFSINSSTGREAIEESLSWPNNEEEGYMFVPIPSLRPVSLPIAS